MKSRLKLFFCLGIFTVLIGCDAKNEIDQKKTEEVVKKVYGGNGCTKIRTPDEIKRGVPCK